MQNLQDLGIEDVSGEGENEQRDLVAWAIEWAVSREGRMGTKEAAGSQGSGGSSSAPAAQGDKQGEKEASNTSLSTCGEKPLHPTPTRSIGLQSADTRLA